MRGQDAVDSETEFILPARELLEAHQTRELFGIHKAGLLIDPENIVMGTGRRGMAIIPKTMVVLHGMIEKSGECGRVDEATRIPLEVENADSLPEDQKRWFWRIEGMGVRPLVRGTDAWGRYSKQGVCAVFEPDRLFGVAIETPKGEAPERVVLHE